MNRICILLLCVFVFEAKSSFAQQLLEGQAVMTFGVYYEANSYSANDWAFLVYDVARTHQAPSGTAWHNSRYRPMNADSIDWKVSRVGPVFAIAIDSTGAFYVAATYSYHGLIAGYGTAGAGGIYKVDANTWNVTDLITTNNSGVYDPLQNTKLPNKGVSLGDLAYDQKHHQLFVSNFEDGAIYRFNTNGTILSRFDPFGLDNGDTLPVAYGEQVWGLAVFTDTNNITRLYFSRNYEDFYNVDLNNDNEIWSVVLDSITGDFIGVPVLEIIIPELNPGTASCPVSDMCFNKDGTLYLAEKSMVMYEANAHSSRVLSYSRTPTGWSLPSKYYLGALSTTDAAGGIDLGYTSENDSTFHCENIIWATTDAMKFDTLYEYGFSGIPVTGNSLNGTDTNYYLNVNIKVDHDENYISVPKTFLGDVEVYRKSCNESWIPPPPFVPDTCPTSYIDFFPNVISPNKDGINDELRITHSCEEITLKVYNRWGMEVYFAKGNTVKWEGEDKQGMALTEGVYYCFLETPKSKKIWYITIFR